MGWGPAGGTQPPPPRALSERGLPGGPGPLGGDAAAGRITGFAAASRASAGCVRGSRAGRPGARARVSRLLAVFSREKREQGCGRLHLAPKHGARSVVRGLHGGASPRFEPLREEGDAS